MPVNPQVVYVPTYNPWTVYGEQVSPYPGFSLLGAVGSFLGSSPINYGLGIAMSAFSQTPWGWLAWGLNWLAQSVLFNQSDYYSHSNTVADWGFQHNGLHAYAGRGAFAGHSYGRTSEGFRRFGDGHNGNRGQGFGHTPGRYAENWRGNSNAGFHAFGTGYDRAPRQAHNDLRAPVSRQQFARGGYGSNWNRGTSEGYRSGARPSYDRSMQAYRAPASGFQRGEFGGRSSGPFGSSNFSHSAGKPPHSGGFHLFGGGHAPKSVSSRGSGGFHMGGGGHAPKSFHGGGNFGGGIARRRRAFRRSRRQASPLKRWARDCPSRRSTVEAQTRSPDSDIGHRDYHRRTAWLWFYGSLPRAVTAERRPQKLPPPKLAARMKPGERRAVPPSGQRCGFPFGCENKGKRIVPSGKPSCIDPGGSCGCDGRPSEFFVRWLAERIDIRSHKRGRAVSVTLHRGGRVRIWLRSNLPEGLLRYRPGQHRKEVVLK